MQAASQVGKVSNIVIPSVVAIITGLKLGGLGICSDIEEDVDTAREEEEYTQEEKEMEQKCWDDFEGCMEFDFLEQC